MNDKNLQGIFHLLSIFLIPAFLVVLFLSDSWLWVVLFLLIAGVILYITFRKK